MRNVRPSHSKRNLYLRIGLTIVALLVVVVTLFLWVLSRQTPPIPLGAPNREIAFVSNANGNWDIYSIDSSGKLTNLTEVGEGKSANDWFASWSLDSKQINFLSDRSGEVGPTQINPDGSNPRSLTVVSAIITLFGEGRLFWDPNWSSEGRMVWASLKDLNLELYLRDSDGSNEIRLTNNPARDWFPAWSPDGKQIAFCSDREGNENIYVMDIEGGEPRRLTDNPADDLRPIWSQDGQQIAFVNEREHELITGVVDLWVMEADGSNQRRLKPEIPFDSALWWSPDGTQAVYMSNREGDWNLYVQEADGENVRRLTESQADDIFPVWRP
jgi:Tol biopolymer transport system component